MLNPSAICDPLRRMEIRFDGMPQGGSLRTVNDARFGMTRNDGTRAHQGVDLYAEPGTPVFAIADGVVERMRVADKNYGMDILLKFVPQRAWLQMMGQSGVHDSEGVLFAEYAHLSSAVVSPGSHVRRGQIIGTTGTSGNADQRYPHLHFELRKVRGPGVGVQGLKNRSIQS